MYVLIGATFNLATVRAHVLESLQPNFNYFNNTKVKVPKAATLLTTTATNYTLNLLDLTEFVVSVLEQLPMALLQMQCSTSCLKKKALTSTTYTISKIRIYHCLKSIRGIGLLCLATMRSIDI